MTGQQISIFENKLSLFIRTVAWHFKGGSANVLVGDVLQLVLRGAHDSIPNVRFTAVRALQEMAPHLDAGAVDSQVCSDFQSFHSCNDHVPVLREPSKVDDPVSLLRAFSVTLQVRPCLTELMQSDPDDDVKFFSAQALESIR